MTTINKKDITRYFLGADDGDYANVALDLGPKSVTVMVESSFGAFCHHWGATGCNPIEFLGRLKFNYAMRKMRGERFMVFDRPAQESVLRKMVLKKRRAKELDAETARWSFDEAAHVCDSYSFDQFYTNMSHSELNEHLRSELDDFEAEKRPDPLCVGFWEAIWIPLMNHLAQTEAQPSAPAGAVA